MPLPDHPPYGEMASPHNQSQALLFNLCLLSLNLSPWTTEKPGLCLLDNLQVSSEKELLATPEALSLWGKCSSSTISGASAELASFISDFPAN